MVGGLGEWPLDRRGRQNARHYRRFPGMLQARSSGVHEVKPAQNQHTLAHPRPLHWIHLSAAVT